MLVLMVIEDMANVGSTPARGGKWSPLRVPLSTLASIAMSCK